MLSLFELLDVAEGINRIHTQGISLAVFNEAGVFFGPFQAL